jgi:Ca2+-binding RTX toxin-like protein
LKELGLRVKPPRQDESSRMALTFQMMAGGVGNDILIVGNGNYIIYGDDANNVFHGQRGNDVLHGGAGNDTLYGGAGNDRIYGGAGNDFVDGRIGQDILTGGAGDDVFFITHPTSNFKTADRITDFITAKENDTLFLGKGVSKVWYRHQDVDGDGILDTVLFRQDENAQMTGIYAIIDDFSTILTGQNFENDGLVITEVV